MAVRSNSLSDGPCPHCSSTQAPFSRMVSTFVLVHLQILILDSYPTTPELTELPHLYPIQLSPSNVKNPIPNQPSVTVIPVPGLQQRHLPKNPMQILPCVQEMRRTTPKAFLFHHTYGADNYQNLIIEVHAPH